MLPRVFNIPYMSYMSAEVYHTETTENLLFVLIFHFVNRILAEVALVMMNTLSLE